jgi:hypothetical protein
MGAAGSAASGAGGAAAERDMRDCDDQLRQWQARLAASEAELRKLQESLAATRDPSQRQKIVTAAEPLARDAEAAAGMVADYQELRNLLLESRATTEREKVGAKVEKLRSKLAARANASVSSVKAERQRETHLKYEMARAERKAQDAREKRKRDIMVAKVQSRGAPAGASVSTAAPPGSAFDAWLRQNEAAPSSSSGKGGRGKGRAARSARAPSASASASRAATAEEEDEEEEEEEEEAPATFARTRRPASASASASASRR